MFQVLNGRVPFQHPKTLQRHKSSTSLVRVNSVQYQHFFGTTTVIVRLGCNLTSVLGDLKAKTSVRVSGYPTRMGGKKGIVIRKYIAAEMA